MKSFTRTVLTETLTAASSYSSGPLDVGDLEFLLISASTSSESGTNTFNISAVDANGNLIKVATLSTNTITVSAVCVGNSSAFEIGGTNSGVPYFGDQVQIDLVSTGTISTQLSMKGK